MNTDFLIRGYIVCALITLMIYIFLFSMGKEEKWPEYRELTKDGNFLIISCVITCCMLWPILWVGLAIELVKEE